MTKLSPAKVVPQICKNCFSFIIIEIIITFLVYSSNKKPLDVHENLVSTIGDSSPTKLL